jgi:hypothetical protein
MSSQQRAKRLRTHQPDAAPAQAQLSSRDQLLLKSPELQSRWMAIRADGVAVREDDAEAEPLDDDGVFLGDGEVVAMAVKEVPPLVWRTFAEGLVALSEEGAVAALISEDDDKDSLTTTGVELTEGKHYWEVELLSGSAGGLVGIGCYLF